MRRHAQLALLLAAALIAAPPPARAGLGTEGILELHAEAIVHGDGTVSVDETILVFAGGSRVAHGITQEIPILYRDQRGVPRRLELEAVSVTRDGQPESLVRDETRDGERLRIGDPRVTLARGTHVYVVSYRTRRQLAFLPDHDELYWNVTGDLGDLAVEQAAAVVRLPGGAAREMGTLRAFILDGAGGGGPGGPAARTLDGERRGPAAVFTVRQLLGPHQGLAVLVTWPKGFVREPGALARAVDLLRDGRTLLLALGALAAQVIGLGAARGASRAAPPPPRAGAAPTGPPGGLPPAALRFAVTRRSDRVALAAALLDAADRRALVLSRDDGGALTCARGETPADALPAEERAAVEALLAADGALRLEASARPRLGAAERALEAALGAEHGDRYLFGRGHYAGPALALSLLVVGALAAGARGGPDRTRAAALGVALPLAWAVAAGLGAACVRLWSRARARPGAAPTARALAWSAAALAAAAAAVSGAQRFAALTSAAALLVLLGTAAADLLVLRLPRGATAAGRALAGEAAAYRAALADPARAPAPADAAYALALGLAPPAGSLGEALAAAVARSDGRVA